jgi:AcrR family transcriptional regulator
MLSVTPNSTPKRRIRTRGKLRVEQLLDAASELLAERGVEEVTFRDIYEKAGIPPGSAYHFFDNIEALHAALFDRFANELIDYYAGSFSLDSVSSWMELMDALVENAVEFYNSHAAARRIIMQPKIQTGVINEADKRSGMRIEGVMNRLFMLPELKNRTDIFILLGKLAYLVFAVSITTYGKITEEMCEEAKTVTKGYLKMYLPEKLEKRG